MAKEEGSEKLKNAKNELFSQELMIDNIGKQAAIRAGYSEKTAEVQASQLLSNPKVFARVTFLRAQLIDKAGVKAEDLVRQMDNLRKANISDYVELMTERIEVGRDEDDEPIIKGIQRLVFKDFEDLSEDQILRIEGIKDGKNGIELKLHGIEWSIEKLNKYAGVYKIDNEQGKETIVITGIDITRTNETSGS